MLLWMIWTGNFFKCCFRQPTVSIFYCLLSKAIHTGFAPRTITFNCQSVTSALDVTLLLCTVFIDLNSFQIFYCTFSCLSARIFHVHCFSHCFTMLCLYVCYVLLISTQYSISLIFSSCTGSAMLRMIEPLTTGRLSTFNWKIRKPDRTCNQDFRCGSMHS